MKDAEFKSVPHCVGSYRIGSLGSEVAAGYKPDLTVKDSAGRLMFIVECEQKTDRKAFLGGLLKAEKYADECDASPVLVIVMQQFDNTTVQQIADHLSPYADWLSRLKPNGLNLAEILVISDAEYQLSIQANEILGSQEFRLRTQRVAYSGPQPGAGADAPQAARGLPPARNATRRVSTSPR